MRRSSLALRVITASCAWRPEQHLGQAHGSVQFVLVLCKHRTLGGVAGTVLSALPHPQSPQCCHSSSSSWDRPSYKRTSAISSPSTSALNSRQSPRSWRSAMFAPFFGGNCPTEEPPRAGEDISTANALPAVGRWRCSPVFNSKVTNRPNCSAVEQQFREPPTSTVAPPRSFPTKQRSDHSAWSSSSPDFRGIAKRNCGGRISSGDVLHLQLFSDWEKRLLIADV